VSLDLNLLDQLILLEGASTDHFFLIYDLNGVDLLLMLNWLITFFFLSVVEWSSPLLRRELSLDFINFGLCANTNLAENVVFFEVFKADDELVKSTHPLFEGDPNVLLLLPRLNRVRWYNFGFI
jgi:hypothetical protein